MSADDFDSSFDHRYTYKIERKEKAESVRHRTPHRTQR